MVDFFPSMLATTPHFNDENWPLLTDLRDCLDLAWHLGEPAEFARLAVPYLLPSARVRTAIRFNLQLALEPSPVSMPGELRRALRNWQANRGAEITASQPGAVHRPRHLGARLFRRVPLPARSTRATSTGSSTSRPGSGSRSSGPSPPTSRSSKPAPSGRGSTPSTRRICGTCSSGTRTCSSSMPATPGTSRSVRGPAPPRPRRHGGLQRPDSARRFALSSVNPTHESPGPPCPAIPPGPEAAPLEDGAQSRMVVWKEMHPGKGRTARK